MKKVIKYDNNTPLSIDISPHGGEKVRCKTGGFDETNEFYSMQASLNNKIRFFSPREGRCRRKASVEDGRGVTGALDRVRGKEV